MTSRLTTTSAQAGGERQPLGPGRRAAGSPPTGARPAAWPERVGRQVGAHDAPRARAGEEGEDLARSRSPRRWRSPGATRGRPAAPPPGPSGPGTTSGGRCWPPSRRSRPDRVGRRGAPSAGARRPSTVGAGGTPPGCPGARRSRPGGGPPDAVGPRTAGSVVGGRLRPAAAAPWPFTDEQEVGMGVAAVEAVTGDRPARLRPSPATMSSGARNSTVAPAVTRATRVAASS